jgi:hypothetical protein
MPAFLSFKDKRAVTRQQKEFFLQQLRFWGV